jgi:hypothetical protein
VEVFWGDPISLDWESEGDARASLRPPPPLLDEAAPCNAAAAAEEACCEVDDDGMVRTREEDSSWLPEACCAPCEGEKGEDMDEMDEARESVWRDDDGSGGGGRDEAAVDVGEKVVRDGLSVLATVVRCWPLEDGFTVLMGGRPRR